MDSEKRIPQVRHRIDVGAECVRRFIGVQIEPLERKDAISFRETKIEGNLVGVKAGRVDHMTRRETSLWRHDRPLLGSQIGSAGVDRNALPERVLSHFFNYPVWIGR